MQLSAYTAGNEFGGVIDECIERYGWAPEHTRRAFLGACEEGDQPVFFRSAEGYGLMTHRVGKREWDVFSEPLAPEEARVPLLLAFFRETLSGDIKKSSLEIRTEEHQALVALLPKHLRAQKTYRRFIWPGINLSGYDGSLSGPERKPLRNTSSKFSREHVFTLVPAGTVEAGALHRVVEAWEENRLGKDHAYAQEYHALIDSKFEGTPGAVLIVDGAPEGIIAGWPVPNSESFYLSVALHSYRHIGLGDMLMLEALPWIQGMGYAFAELGGCDRKLLAFKEKFGAVPNYTTDCFSVVLV